jgi:hypothetical protein
MQYRVWLHDITLQPIIVEAENAKQAMFKAEVISNSAVVDKEWEDFYQSQWEASSAEPVIE